MEKNATNFELPQKGRDVTAKRAKSGAAGAAATVSEVSSSKHLHRLGLPEVPEGWRLKFVGEVCTIRNDVRLPLSAQVRAEMSGDFPYYGPTGILDYLSEYRAEGEFALIGEDGDHFLEPESKPQTLLVSGKLNVNNHAHVIADSADCLASWFQKFFEHRDISFALTRQGAGRFKLTKATLERLPLLLPPIEEQRRITAVLDAWDESINAIDQLSESKSRQLESLYSRFFLPCHPKTPSRPPGWKRFKLGQVFSERDELGTDADKLLSITMDRGVIPRDEVGRVDTSPADKSAYKLISPGDIGYNTMRMWQGVSGLSVLQGIISPAYTVVVPDNLNILGGYAAHLFKSRRMIFEFERFSQGLTSEEPEIPSIFRN